MTDQPTDLPILPKHLKELVEGSGISLDVLRKAQIWSETDAKAASKLLGRAPKYWAGHMNVWIAPYFIPFHRDPVLHRGKPDKPFEKVNKDGSISNVKYVQPKGSPVHVYFPPRMLEGRALKDVSVPLWITEGEKKALSADSHGLACVAVPGVHQWHRKGETGLHPDFAHIPLDGREVFLAFDRDALSNKDVRGQERALGRVLLAAGAKVYVVRLPEDAPKLDDFLVSHELTELAELMDDARKRGRIEVEVQAVGMPPPGTEMTDLGNAERFAKQHGEDLRYCEQTQSWYLWTGKRWELDSTGAVVRRAMRTVRSIYAEADALQDEDSRNAMRQHARKSESQARIQAIVKLGGALNRMAVKLEAFDADPWLLNVENGTLDLRTGELMDHERAHLITKVAPVYYDPDARHDKWERFLEGISNGNPEIVDFLARAVGYSLTGDTREDKWFMLYGQGGRGKSTFASVIEAVMGDYARTADTSTFLASPMGSGGDKPRPDLVRLTGSRIVFCKEVEENARLDEGLVKTVTGGDVITVRDLRSRPFEMRPSYKLWIVANDAPLVRGDDSGMWRRVIRVPFDRDIKNPEKGFREAMAAEPELRSAVLAWMMAGVRLWLSDGLRVPDVIAESTAKYRAEMDFTGEFLDRRCEFEGDARVARKVLRQAYVEWCEEQGHKPWGARRFTAAVRERARKHGFDPADMETSVRDGSRVLDGWKFVRLLTDVELASEERWGKRHSVHTRQGDDGGCRVVGAVEGSPIYGAYARETNLELPLRLPNYSDIPTVTTTNKKENKNSKLGCSDDVGTGPEQNPTVPTDAAAAESEGWVP